MFLFLIYFSCILFYFVLRIQPNKTIKTIDRTFSDESSNIHFTFFILYFTSPLHLTTLRFSWSLWKFTITIKFKLMKKKTNTKVLIGISFCIGFHSSGVFVSLDWNCKGIMSFCFVFFFVIEPWKPYSLSKFIIVSFVVNQFHLSLGRGWISSWYWERYMAGRSKGSSP